MAEQTEQRHQAPQSRFFKAWAELVLRFRWVFLILSLLGTGFAVHQTRTNMTLDTSFESFLASDSEPAQVLEEYRDDFGSDRVFDVLIEGDVFSVPYLEKLKKLHDEVARLDVTVQSLGYRRNDPRSDERQPVEGEATTGPPPDGPAGGADAPAGEDGFEDFDDFGEEDDGFGEVAADDGWGESGGSAVITHVTSLINARQTVWENGGLKSGGLFDEKPKAEELPALKKKLLSDEYLVGQIGQVLGKGGRHSVVVVQTDFMDEEDREKVYNGLVRIVEKYDSAGFHGFITGMPALTISLNKRVLDDLYKLLTIALLVMVFFLAVIFRHPWGVIGPICVVIQSAVWTLGLMAWTGAPLTVVTNVLPTFLLCVGIADSVHIQSVYRDARKRGEPNREAIVHAVSTTGIPVFFTTLTTCMGLASFRFATLQAIQDMGIYGAFGVAVALVQSLVFLPIVLTFNKKSLLGVKPASAESAEAEPRRRDLLDRFLELCDRISRGRVVKGRVSHAGRYATLVLVSLVTAVGLYGAAQMGVSQNPLNWVPEDDPTIDHFEAMNQYLGGAGHLLLMIEANPGKDLRDRELLLRLEKLEERIKAYRDPESGKRLVGQMASLLDVVRESYRAINNGEQKYYRIPETQGGVADMLTLFESASPDRLKRIATIDLRKTISTMRVQWIDAWAFKPMSDYIDRSIEEVVGDAGQVRTTGSMDSNVSVIRELITDLLKSFGTAFAVIAVTMILLLRRVKLGLISMVPNLFPMIVVLGFMSFADIPLNLSNLMVWSIAIGLIVDNTIHMLHQFRTHYELHGSVDGAISHAFRHTGRAITTTSVILVAGFMVYLAGHLRNIQQLGKLLALVLTLAMLTNLILAPALLRTLFRSRGDG